MENPDIMDVHHPRQDRRPPAAARRARGGNYAVLFGVSMIGVLGFAALAVDMSWLLLADNQAQNAADAAAHAGLIVLRNERDPVSYTHLTLPTSDLV